MFPGGQNFWGNCSLLVQTNLVLASCASLSDRVAGAYSEWKCTWKLHADRCWRNLTEYKQSTNMLWFQFKEHSLYVSLFLKLWLVTISRGKKNYREKGWVPHSLQLVSVPWSFSLSFSSIYSESLCMCVYACCEVKILLLHPQMYLHLFQAKSSKILSPYWITMILLSKKNAN